MATDTRETSELRDTKSADIQKVIDEVKRQLAEARSQAPDLKLKEFELELALVVERSGSVGVVFKGELGDSVTHKIALTYGPPEPKKSESIVPPMGLAAALRTIQENIKAGQRTEPKLDFKSGEVSVEFVVKRGVGIEFSFGPVKFGGDYKREETNTVTLKFDV